jgi:hypothetical protein
MVNPVVQGRIGLQDLSPSQNIGKSIFFSAPGAYGCLQPRKFHFFERPVSHLFGFFLATPPFFFP